MTWLKKLACAAVLAVAASGVSAGTIDFDGASLGTHTNYTEDGFVFDKVRVVRAYCEAKASKPCGAENAFRDSTLTRVNGGTFDVNSLWFSLLTLTTPLTLVTDRGTEVFSIGSLIDGVVVQQNKGYNLDLSSFDIFKNVSFLKIVDISLGQTGTGHGKGDFRFDNIDVAPIPLPAAGVLLLAGVGALGVMRRRKQRA